MRVLIATDAWALQVDGAVRTPTSLAGTAPWGGPDIVALAPEAFPRFLVPGDPGRHPAIPGRHETARRIATTGRIGRAKRATGTVRRSVLPGRTSTDGVARLDAPFRGMPIAADLRAAIGSGIRAAS
ncbi:hypothetical protein [uncultured Methylobacterium sp.]|uniref:hypothetical protein n=1 Tax=uncultured Methylobacterium sp. TaxID=157278 RepID=UPI002623773F|nr:hypothetical protein [uncultured Methylobacterium sp.]